MVYLSVLFCVLCLFFNPEEGGGGLQHVCLSSPIKSTASKLGRGTEMVLKLRGGGFLVAHKQDVYIFSP